MRKFLLTGTIALVFALYVWRADRTSLPNGTNIPAPVTSGTALLPTEPAAPAQAGGFSVPPVSDTPPPQPTPTPSPAPSQTPSPTPAQSGLYRDGTYQGVSANAYYGNIQVAGVVRNGKLSDVQILDYPSDRGHSIMINNYALPTLISEAVSAQSAQVDIVSGATDTSMAFRESLASALALARK